MSETASYDVIIIGSGPGGFAAAMRTSRLGLRTCVVEKGLPGGVCVNEGCIPTKSLVHQAGIFAGQAGLKRMGITVDTGGFDYREVYGQSRNAAELVSKGVRFQFDNQHIDLYEHKARLLSPTEVSLSDGTFITGRNIILATGSRARALPMIPFDETDVLSSTGALHLTELPSSVLIVGGGYIGCEFAHIFSSFGSKVTLVEMADRILPGMDADIVKVLARSFRRNGIAVKTSARPTGMTRTGNGMSVTVESPAGISVVEAEKVLVSVGRTPNARDIGLDAAGLATDSTGGIPTGDFFRTEIPTIYAIGDVTGRSFLAHTASKTGEIAADAIAGVPTGKDIDTRHIPAAVFTEPPAAQFGLTEEAARQQHIPCLTKTMHYRGSGKAIADNTTDGLIKVLLDPDASSILGASVIGRSAPEIIHELLLAATTGIAPDTLGQMIHIHPTFSELVQDVMG